MMGPSRMFYSPCALNIYLHPPWLFLHTPLDPKAQKIAGVSGPLPAAKNQAFVFVKPHAVTPATVALVYRPPGFVNPNVVGLYSPLCVHPLC